MKKDKEFQLLLDTLRTMNIYILSNLYMTYYFP